MMGKDELPPVMMICDVPNFTGTLRGPIGPFKGISRRLYGKCNKMHNFNAFSDFAFYGSWDGLIWCKILLRGLGTISTPGKPNSEKSSFR